MLNEAEPDVNYESVDMSVFFYGGLVFMLLFRVATILFIIFGRDEIDHDISWWDYALALMDMFILRTVFESFKEASKMIQNNQVRLRDIRTESNHKDVLIETNNVRFGSVDTFQTKSISNKNIVLDDCEPVECQQMVQLIESVTESMPQVILQSVFLIRSLNDPTLKQDANNILIGTSLIASLLSITTKFGFVDGEDVREEAESAKLSTSRPYIQHWYVCRILWRFCAITTRFMVLSLLWAVVGGLYLPMYTFMSVLFWWGMRVAGNGKSCDFFDNCCSSLKWHSLWIAFALVTVVGGVIAKIWRLQIAKWVENILLLTIISLFTVLSFECFQCASSDARQFGSTGNPYIFWFLISGWVACLMEIVTYVAMARCDMISETYLRGG